MLKRLLHSLLFLFFSVCLLSCATKDKNKTTPKELADASKHLGEGYLGERNYTAALREFLKAEKINDKDPYLQNDLGLAYIGKEKLDTALIHFDKAVSLKSDYASAWNNMGIVHLRLEEWDKAIESFDRALEQLLYATPHFALNNVGEAYRGKKDYVRSIQAYHQALAAQPGFFRAYRGMALTYMAMGDYDAAAASLENAVEMAPDYALGFYDLGRVYVFKRKRETAIAAFRWVLRPWACIRVQA
ncbi:MAG: tetratricopeptide repeat protein [Deltaproteobacteria bacterium]|nr:tetratricopeptide repeat protein [Deltaproteobacteria bacterium]